MVAYKTLYTINAYRSVTIIYKNTLYTNDILSMYSYIPIIQYNIHGLLKSHEHVNDDDKVCTYSYAHTYNN